MRRPEGPGAEPRCARRMASTTASRESTLGTPEARPNLVTASSPAGSAPRHTRRKQGPAGQVVEGYGPCARPPARRRRLERPSARARPRLAGRHEQGAVRTAGPQSRVRAFLGRRCSGHGGGFRSRLVGELTNTRPHQDPPARPQSRQKKRWWRAPLMSAACPKPLRPGQGVAGEGWEEEEATATRGADREPKEPTRERLREAAARRGAERGGGKGASGWTRRQRAPNHKPLRGRRSRSRGALAPTPHAPNRTNLALRRALTRPRLPSNTVRRNRGARRPRYSGRRDTDSTAGWRGKPPHAPTAASGPSGRGRRTTHTPPSLGRRPSRRVRPQ